MKSGSVPSMPRSSTAKKLTMTLTTAAIYSGMLSAMQQGPLCQSVLSIAPKCSSRMSLD